MAFSAEERATGLAAAARTIREQLIAAAETIASRGEVLVVDAPAAGSVMVQLATPVGAFCLTEAVVTTCAVEVGGRHGWAAVMGWDDEASLAAAIVDATPEVADSLAVAALAAARASHLEEATAVAATRVER